MKKLIPILSLTLCSAIMSNCTQRDEDTASPITASKNAKEHLLISKDSTDLSGHHLDPDPPVRDGDDWRHIKKTPYK